MFNPPFKSGANNIKKPVLNDITSKILNEGNQTGISSINALQDSAVHSNYKEIASKVVDL